MTDHQFYCGECLQSFSCPIIVPIHFQLEHEFRCVCDRRFSDRVELLTHIESVGCRFPFSVEVSRRSTVAQLSATTQKPKFAETRRSHAFDAANACIRKTENGFSCGICGKISARRYRLWQHIRKIHVAAVKKMALRHLKTVVQRYCVTVGEALACVVCGKPYLTKRNFYDHFCTEHTLEISQITVEIEEQEDAEENSALTVLRNGFYARLKQGKKYRCLICRAWYQSLLAVTKHLRKHGRKLKECFDKIVTSVTLNRQQKKRTGPSGDDISAKYDAEDVKFRTERDGDRLNRRSLSSSRSEAFVKRPEQELEFLRGYIAKKETFYYCQLCPTKSVKKGYLYQHLTLRHDDLLGETLATFRQNEVNVFEDKDASESAVAQSGTHSLGNVVGNVEFHADVWTSENDMHKTTGSVALSESCGQKPHGSQSVSDSSLQGLAVSQDAYLEHAGHYDPVKVDSISSAFSHNLSYAGLPGLNDGKISAIPQKRKPDLPPTPSDGVPASDELFTSKSPDVSGSVRKDVSEVSRSFCARTRTYVCSICNHRLLSKSGWYKHRLLCKVGAVCGRQKLPYLASGQIRMSESAVVDRQHCSDPLVLDSSKVKKSRGNGQKMWKCATCKRQFISHSGRQRHFIYCKRKRLTIRKRLVPTKQESEYVRKNCCQKGERFECRICGLDYKRIYDTFHHIRQKHGMVDKAGGDDNDVKLDQVNPQSAVDRSPAKLKMKGNERKKGGLKIRIVNPGLKSTSAEAVLKRRNYVYGQILLQNGRYFCRICGSNFSWRCSARNHIKRMHLGLRNRSPGASISPVGQNLENAASTKVNGLRVKDFYKRRNTNFANGMKARMKGTKLKTEAGSASPVKSCGLCSRRFLSLHSLTAHVSSEHMTIDATPFPCVMCPRDFEKRQYCVRHFVHAHCLRVKSAGKVGKKHHCKICDIYFPSRTIRLQHLSEAHADVCEFCSTCGAIFLTKQDLGKHVRAMHSANISDILDGQISKDLLQNPI